MHLPSNISLPYATLTDQCPRLLWCAIGRFLDDVVKTDGPNTMDGITTSPRTNHFGEVDAMSQPLSHYNLHMHV